MPPDPETAPAMVKVADAPTSSTTDDVRMTSLERETDVPPATVSELVTVSGRPFIVYMPANVADSMASPLMSLLSASVAAPAGNSRTIASDSEVEGAPPADQLAGSDQVDEAAPLQTCVAISSRSSNRSTVRIAAAARTAPAARRGFRARYSVIQLT